jgi:ATP-dependent protease ClpP protease subunit
MPKKPKEILIYHNIDSWSSTDIIEKMAEVEDDEDLTIRLCSDGGDPDYGFGVIAKFKEHKGKKLVKVDGKAHSMAFFFLCYSDDSETIDTSEHVFHRASYPEWYETSDRFTPERRAFLERTNSYLRKALEAKVDVAKLEGLKAMKGLKVKDIFSLDNRIDIFLTAQDLKAIGLVDRVVKITPQKAAEVNSQLQAFGKAAIFSEETVKQAATETIENPKTEIKKPTTMTKQELQDQFPAVYAQILKEGVDKGVEQEKDRVEACLTFIDVDPKGVIAAVASGKPLSQKQMADFSYKTMNKAALGAAADDSKGAVTTGKAKDKDPEDEEKEGEEKEAADFKAATLKNLGIDKSAKKD